MYLASVRWIIHQFHKIIASYSIYSLVLKIYMTNFVSVKLLSLVILGRENDIVLQIQRGFVIALERLEVQNQVILDSEHSIRLEPWVVSGVELRRAAAEIRVRYL